MRVTFIEFPNGADPTRRTLAPVDAAAIVNVGEGRDHVQVFGNAAALFALRQGIDDLQG